MSSMTFGTVSKNTNRKQITKMRVKFHMNLKKHSAIRTKSSPLWTKLRASLTVTPTSPRWENTYLRHKVMPEAEDETVLIAPETEYYEQITGIAHFLLYLLGEKDRLFAAIRKAKRCP